MTGLGVVVTRDDVEPAAASEIEELLRETYVGGGFTDDALAAVMFQATAVRARGTLLLARDEASRDLLGMIIVVPDDSHALRLAATGEGELHLLAVTPRARGRGIGRRLVEAALDAQIGPLVLWTQSSMQSAQRLYERTGFRRAPERDFERAGRDFLVYVHDRRER